MKKLFVAVLSLFLVLIVSAAPAADLQLGIDTDFILKREIELENLGIDAEYSAQYYDLTLAVQVGDLLTIKPKVGLNYSAIGFDTGIGDIELNNELGWNIGVDAKADVYTIPKIDVDLALIGGYRFSKTEIDKIDITGLVINNPIETDLTIHEWEVGVVASKDLTEIGIPITPYVGVVYSDLVGDIDVNLSAVNLNENIEAKDNIGLRVGVAAEPKENLKISIAAHFLDETAITGRISYKF